MVETETTLKTAEEAHAYTPGLKVKKSTLVTKERKLPIPGEVLVKEGDKVDFDTPIARTQIPGNPEVMKAALALTVTPEELPHYLKKYEGDLVKKGEVIAQYIAFFGLIKRYVRAPIDGIIESISTASGQIIIREPPVEIDVNAYIPGTVVKVLPGEGAIIEANAAFIQAIFGVGGETRGDLVVVVDDPNTPLTAELVKPEHKGKILVGGSIITKDALEKAVELGVIGLVAASIRDVDLMDFLGYEIGVAITGEEDIPITVLITEGFGEMMMSHRTFDLLKSLDGYAAAINGTTQIRAGVLRPEIVIPLKKERTLEDIDAELSGGMKPGTPVRIIREPYFGGLGIVSNLPVELQQVESESYVRVVEVKLDTGELVTVPRANVEIIEE